MIFGTRFDTSGGVAMADDNRFGVGTMHIGCSFVFSGMTAQSVIPRPMPQSDFLRPVDVTGEVNKSGTFPVIDAPTLAQLLQMAGGLTRNAGPTAILIHFSDNPPRMPLGRASLTALVRP